MEIFDVYNNDRIKTGATHIRGEKCDLNENRVVVHIVIFNSKNEMLIQRRQLTKSSFGGRWDISCGGCSTTGETSGETATREIKEELGLDIDLTTTRPHFTMNFEHGFDDFYILNMDIDLKDITIQEEEVMDVKWASKDEILDMYYNSEFVNYLESFLHVLWEFKTQRGVLKGK